MGQVSSKLFLAKIFVYSVIHIGRIVVSEFSLVAIMSHFSCNSCISAKIFKIGSFDDPQKYMHISSFYASISRIVAIKRGFLVYKKWNLICSLGSTLISRSLR